MTLATFFATYVKFFFILTPFFITSVFIALTEDEPKTVRHQLAGRITLSVAIISLVLLWAGKTIFDTLSITVDAFRIGAGALLFRSALSLVEGTIQVPNTKGNLIDLAVVPLSIPMTLGPGSVGALVLMSSETESFATKGLTSLAILLSIFSLGILLYLSAHLVQWVGRNGISMLSKITGLVLSALSSQMIFTGVAHFLK